MSSDTYRVNVLSVEGADVVMEVRPTTAGGLCDTATTRSFVLMLLQGQGGPVELEQTMDTRWLADHLDRFVARVRIERLSGMFTESLLRDYAATYCVPATHLQPRVTLRATMASPDLAAFFQAGEYIATTAFDAWDSDPVRTEFPPNVHEPAPCWDPDPELASRVAAAIGPRLRGFRAGGALAFVLEGPSARLTVQLASSTATIRSMIDVYLALDVPAIATLPAGRKRGERISSQIAWGRLAGRRAPSWFREWAAPGTETPDVRYWDDEAIEPHEALIDRLALELDRPEINALLTRDGVIGLFESGLAGLVPRARPADFARLSAAEPPALGERWQWDWSVDPFWRRVAVHAALGERDHARAALAQAQGRWKRAPKAYAALIASLAAG